MATTPAVSDSEPCGKQSARRVPSLPPLPYPEGHRSRSFSQTACVRSPFAACVRSPFAAGARSELPHSPQVCCFYFVMTVFTTVGFGPSLLQPPPPPF